MKAHPAQGRGGTDTTDQLPKLTRRQLKNRQSKKKTKEVRVSPGSLELAAGPNDREQLPTGKDDLSPGGFSVVKWGEGSTVSYRFVGSFVALPPSSYYELPIDMVKAKSG